MNSKRRSPTMKDVAKEAGVALGTVSKVINGLPVGEDYRIRVEEASRRLGYQINSYAKGLKTDKTNTIALILPNLSFPFFASLANEVSAALKKKEYKLLVETTDYDPEAEQKCIQMVQQNKVDGIICMSYNPELKVDTSLPFVSIDRYFSTSIPCVSSDNFYGGQLAVKKLASFGCRKLLFLRTGSNVKGESDKRQLGFDAQCQLLGLEHFDIVLHDGDSWDTFSKYIDEHIAIPEPEFDGIFCNTDHLAFFALKHLRSKGIRVPEDIQLMGYDGIRHFGDGDYYVSTIVQPIQQMAESAIDMILNKNTATLSPLICLPVTYAYGGTTLDENAVSGNAAKNTGAENSSSPVA